MLKETVSSMGEKTVWDIEANLGFRGSLGFRGQIPRRKIWETLSGHVFEVHRDRDPIEVFDKVGLIPFWIEGRVDNDRMGLQRACILFQMGEVLLNFLRLGNAAEIIPPMHKKRSMERDRFVSQNGGNDVQIVQILEDSWIEFDMVDSDDIDEFN